MTWLQRLNCLLLSMDEKWLSFIGDLLVAMAALVGVAMTGRFAVLQYREQQKERATDRELEIRKQLMIEGIRGANEAGQVLASSGDLEVTQDQLNERFRTALSTFITAMAMAKLPTVRLAREFHKAILRQQLEIMLRRENLLLMQHEWRDAAQAVYDKLQAIQSGNAGDPKAQIAEWEELESKRDALWRAIVQERAQFGLANLRRLDGFMPEQYRVIGGIRKDLGLDGTVGDYTRAAEISSADMQALIDETLAALETTDEEGNKAARGTAA